MKNNSPAVVRYARSLVLVSALMLGVLSGSIAAAEPILVELFTSQGCSSCPPADRLLGRLAGEPGEVIPLSYHVDYWNYIGWTDPFSSEAWSDRQRRYASAFGAARIYTPQLVIDGRTDCVGSDEKEVRGQLAAAARRQAGGKLTLDVAPAPSNGHLQLDITAKVVEAVASERWRVMVAVFERDLVTSVPRGENSGRSLRNDHVVRTLTEAFSVAAKAGAEESGQIEVKLGSDWKRENLGVAVFLQDPDSMHIHGAAVRYLDG